MRLLFDLQNDDRYISLLKILAMIPVEGISRKHLNRWLNLGDDDNNVLDDLIRDSLLEDDRANNKLKLHPLLRELILSDYPADMDDSMQKKYRLHLIKELKQSLSYTIASSYMSLLDSYLASVERLKWLEEDFQDKEFVEFYLLASKKYREYGIYANLLKTVDVTIKLAERNSQNKLLIDAAGCKMLALWRMQKYQKANQLYDYIKKLNLEIRWDNCAYFAAFENNMGKVYYRQNKYDQAKKQFSMGLSH